MKKALIVLCLALLFLPSAPVSAQPGKSLSVYRQDNVKFPWGLSGLSVVDGVLHGYNGDLMLMGEMAQPSAAHPSTDAASPCSLLRLAPDTVLGKLLAEATFVVLNPSDSLLYFNVLNTGVERLNLLRKDKGTYRVSAVEPKGWSGGIGHPAFSPDGRFMVFSATGSNGLGGHDLWCSRLGADGWERPVNLGARVNTKGDETAPVFYGHYLLFVSNGHNPSGDAYSLYSVAFPDAKSDDQLIFYPYALQRLPEPLNSTASDRELALDPQRGMGYWISSRDGHEALYTFHGRLDGMLCSGTVVGEKGKPVAGATVTALADHRVAASTHTDAQGFYSLYLQPGARYRLGIVGSGYYMHTDTLLVRSHSADSLFTEVRRDVRLTPLPVGQPMTFDNLFGPATDVELTNQGSDLLMIVVQSLRDSKTLRAELRLTSRVSADEALNNMLNERRLNALREFFGAYFPSTDRISFVNANSEAALSNTESRGDRLRVIFAE